MTDTLTNIPAATVVVFRNGAAGQPPELLMLERSGSMRFAGGAAVFPGGRIDLADHELAESLAHGLELDEAAARVAAVRETLEEAGLVLAMHVPVTAQQAADARAMLAEVGTLAPVLEHFGWVPDLTALHPWARWCPDWNGAFDTRFYLADLGTGAVDISKDDTENSHLFWASAAGALAMADREEISVIFPTRRNLERLALHKSFIEACDFAARYPIRTIAPQRRQIDGVEHLTIPDDLGYPVTSQVMISVKRG
jgi:8-oxo-dGTP pyrophosphatase MutT (NUDIX family)